MTTSLGGTNAPASLDQVLYVDNSELFSVIGSTNDVATTGIISMNTFRNGFAKNAIIYLPFRSAAQATTKNVAVKKEGSTTDFTSPVDFELTDKNPFYAPFNIQLETGKFATYARQMTYEGHGSTTFASLVLPFGLTVGADGKHTDSRGGFHEFTMGTMKENGLTYDGVQKRQGVDYEATAQFKKLTADAEANKPYMVQLPKADVQGNILFTVRQEAALIKQTPEKNQSIKGESVQNMLSGAPANFTSYHTYSGLRMQKESNPNVFYFSHNKFVALKNLKKSTFYLWPFRAFYTFDSAPSLAAKQFAAFNISFEDVNENETTGITNIDYQPTLAITTVKHSIIAKASVDTQVAIYTTAGLLVVNTMVKAGEVKTFNVPNGLYIINGKKISVK